jgi:cell division protein FtsB
MKILAGILGALILLIQYPLWLGKGSWMRAWQVEQDFNKQRNINVRLEARNAGLAAEVSDLKNGTEAIEERARYELGLVRGDEIFFQIEDKDRAQSPISGSKPSGAK